MRIQILHMRYWPDATGTGPLVTELAQDLVSMGHATEVICSAPHYGLTSVPEEFRGGLLMKSEENGVEVHRTKALVWAPGSVLGRAIDYLSFTLLASIAAIRSPKPNVILAISPPITIGIVGIVSALVHRSPMVLGLQDIWPDGLIEMGRLRNRFLIRLLRIFENSLYSSSKAIIVLSEGMKNLLTVKGVPTEKIVVIPNWVDPEVIYPVAKDNPFRSRVASEDCFVVLFAGNIGYAAALESVLRAAEVLQDQSKIRFVIVGEGSAKPDLVKLADRLQLENIKFETTQPVSELANVYGSADLSLVTLRKGMGNISVPSKSFAIMASERPILASVPEDSEVCHLIDQSGAGWYIPPEAPEFLAEEIRERSKQQSELNERARNGRRYVLDQFARSGITKKYADLLNEISQQADSIG